MGSSDIMQVCFCKHIYYFDCYTYDFSGLLVPGGFGDRGIEGMIAACKWAREHNIPFLGMQIDLDLIYRSTFIGVCLGMQCAVIEFARNVCEMCDANSTEFNQSISSDQQVVINMPEHAPGADRGMGGTMRLGRRTTVFLTEHSKLCQFSSFFSVDNI